MNNAVSFSGTVLRSCASFLDEAPSTHPYFEVSVRRRSTASVSPDADARHTYPRRSLQSAVAGARVIRRPPSLFDILAAVPAGTTDSQPDNYYFMCPRTLPFVATAIGPKGGRPRCPIRRR